MQRIRAISFVPFEIWLPFWHEWKGTNKKARIRYTCIDTMATNQQKKKARHIYICFSITTMIEVFELSTNRDYCTAIVSDHRLLIFKFWKMRNHHCEFSDSDAVISQHSNHRGETPQTKRNNKMKIIKWNSNENSKNSKIIQ